MADLSQVRDQIASNIQTPVYPNGTSMPSIAGVPVTINSGYPIRTQLDQQLQAGNAMVSVYPLPQERVMTKFERIYQPNSYSGATLVLTVNLNAYTVTITGTISIPQAVMFIVNGVGYAYQVLANDTLDSIAINMAALISGAHAIGNVVYLPISYSIIARISSNCTASLELARVDRVFCISIWSPSENIRFLLGNAIDIYMKENYRQVMPDNFFAQVFYHDTKDTDMLDKSLIYKRDLNYTIQYATTLTNNFSTITDPYVEELTLEV
jgi:hypothetical protein